MTPLVSASSGSPDVRPAVTSTAATGIKSLSITNPPASAFGVQLLERELLPPVAPAGLEVRRPALPSGIEDDDDAAAVGLINRREAVTVVEQVKLLGRLVVVELDATL